MTDGPPSYEAGMTRSLALVGLLSVPLVACSSANSPAAAPPVPVASVVAPSGPARCSHEPQILAPQGSLLGIASDDQRVYWADGVGAVMAIPKGGGTATTLAKTSLAPQSIAARGGDVFWVEYGAVKAMSGSGGPERTIARGTGPTRGLAVAGDELVVVDLDRDAVTALAVGGGAKRAVFAGVAAGYRVAADAAGVAFFRVTENRAIDLVTVATGLDARVIVHGPLTPGPLVMDHASVWFDGGAGLQKVARAGGTAVAVAPDHVLDLAVDGGDVYFMTSAGELKRATADGRSQTLAPVDPPARGGLVVDDQCVYFAAKGSVMKVAKP